MDPLISKVGSLAHRSSGDNDSNSEGSDWVIIFVAIMVVCYCCSWCILFCLGLYRKFGRTRKPKPVTRAQPRLKCPLCGQEGFADQGEQDRHMDSLCPERKVTCDYPGCNELYKVNDDHPETCPKRPDMCDKCQLQLPRSQLRDHEADHKPPCKWCGEYTRWDVDLDQHQKNCDARQMSCNKCGSKVAYRDREVHMHETCPNRTSICNMCSMEVKHSELDRHLQNECGGRQMQCDLCGDWYPTGGESQHKESPVCLAAQGYRPYLGTHIMALDDGLGGRDNVIVVESITRGSPADQVGILANDRITHLNGRTIDSKPHFNDQMKQCKIGQVVTLTIIRDGREIKQDITLGRSNKPQQSHVVRANNVADVSMLSRNESYNRHGDGTV